MRSASRQALTELRQRQTAVLGGASTVTLTGVADELYAVAALFVAQPRLRRTVGDPTTTPESRTALAQQLLSGKVSDTALQIVTAATEQRWSSPWDLTDALELAGDDALFAAAESEGTLDETEDELFRVERILLAAGSLTGLLDEQSAPAQRRAQLLGSLIDGKVSDLTRRLLLHAVSSSRKRSITLAIDDLLQAAAERRDRSVARVISAVPLTQQQETRLAAALSEFYNRAISLRTAVEPGIRGGLVIRLGDEIIDGSVASRLVGARAALSQ